MAMAVKRCNWNLLSDYATKRHRSDILRPVFFLKIPLGFLAGLRRR